VLSGELIDGVLSGGAVGSLERVTRGCHRALDHVEWEVLRELLGERHRSRHVRQHDHPCGLAAPQVSRGLGRPGVPRLLAE
jgi:hypothetical protein